MTDVSDSSRRENEIALLEAIYPEEISFDVKVLEFKYQDTHGSLILRLSSEYPSRVKPTVISARSKNSAEDVREKVRESIASLDPGEELLDIIISAFKDIALACPTSKHETSAGVNHEDDGSSRNTTIIIWLHHLLATEKRKLATRPSNAQVSGLSKPGYPGVMIFSGSAAAVREHVAELKSLNWQAFQVRYEEDEEWTFAHGSGVKELESMSEVTQDIGEDRKTVFLESMRMKS